jgi:hypothetical protein
MRPGQARTNAIPMVKGQNSGSLPDMHCKIFMADLIALDHTYIH